MEDHENIALVLQGTIAELDHALSKVTAEKDVLQKELKKVKEWNDNLISEIRKHKESLQEMRTATKEIFVKAVAFDKMMRSCKNIAILCDNNTSLRRCWNQFENLFEGSGKGILYSLHDRRIIFTDGGCIQLYIDQRGLEMHVRGIEFDQILKYYW